MFLLPGGVKSSLYFNIKFSLKFSAYLLSNPVVPGAPQINVSRVAIRSLDNREPVSIRIGQALSVLSGTKVSVECHVSGVPEPDVTWSRQDSNMDTDGRVLVEGSVLIITSTTKADTGVYLCKAVNLAGEVVASSMVNVTSKSVHCIDYESCRYKPHHKQPPQLNFAFALLPLGYRV